MSVALDQWLRRQAAREERVVVLEEGLLGERLWRYFFYRLRYFFLTYVVESAAHAVTVLYLFRSLAWENFLLVLVASAIGMLLAGTWWGALEAMRAQVRDLHRGGKPHRIAAQIGGWLTLSLALGAIFLLAAIGWTAAQAATGNLGPAEAYVATLMLRLAVDLPVRCYHSGVYALRRVYKPLSASLAPELANLVVMVALWQAIGVWALVVSSLVSTALLTAVGLHYTHRVYAFLGMEPQRHLGLLPMRRALRGSGREPWAAGAAHASMALDSLAVLALLYGAKTDSRALVVLYLAGPTIRAGADWARLLYFDLKRLELRLFTNLRARFERYTLRLAWALGILFWAIAAVITTVFYGHGVGVMYPALLAFFVARSLLAREQIQSFSEAHYAAVLGTGAACVAGLAAVGVLAGSEAVRLGGVALVTAACAVGLGWLTRMRKARGEPGFSLQTLEWLRRLGHVPDAVRVGSARVVSAPGPDRLDARGREDRTRWRLGQLAERTARRLGRSGAAAWVGPDRLVWFEPVPAPERRARIEVAWLQHASGGLISSVTTRDCPDGEEALLAAGHEQLLGRASSHLLTAVLPVDVVAARKHFGELVPDGMVYSPEEPVPPQLARLPGTELRAILFDALSFARDLGAGRRRSRFDVTALCTGGELRLIFVADLHAGRKPRGRWRAEVTALNVRAAIGGARRGRPKSGITLVPWQVRAPRRSGGSRSLPSSGAETLRESLRR